MKTKVVGLSALCALCVMCIGTVDALAATEAGTVVHVVRVGQAIDAVRVIPSDATRWGLSYEELLLEDGKTAVRLFIDIKTARQRGLTDIGGFREVLFSKGDFPRKDGSPGWVRDAKLPLPIASGNFSAGACEFDNAESLGKDGSKTFVLLKAICPSAPAPYQTMLIGMTLEGDRVTDFAVNVGDLAPLIQSK